ncbi:hypothetical protein [Haloarcula montana]|nr:hypothetical protein [Haloarcula sp. GH36]
MIEERGELYLDEEISTYEDEPDEVPEVDDSTEPPSTEEPDGPNGVGNS